MMKRFSRQWSLPTVLALFIYCCGCTGPEPGGQQAKKSAPDSESIAKSRNETIPDVSHEPNLTAGAANEKHAGQSSPDGPFSDIAPTLESQKDAGSSPPQTFQETRAGAANWIGPGATPSTAGSQFEAPKPAGAQSFKADSTSFAQPRRMAPNLAQPPAALPEASSSEPELPEITPPLADVAEASQPKALFPVTSVEPSQPVETRMKVFYATDRVARDSLQSGQWSAIFLKAIVGAAVCAFFVTLTFFAQRKFIPVTLATIVGVLSAVFAYYGNIEWQKRLRLAASGDAYYTSEMNNTAGSDQLEYGICLVTIPPDHRVGRLESPSILRLEFREDPKKHVILERVVRCKKTIFYSDLNQCLDEGLSRQAFVFIHGYNVGFEDAVKRTAQIAFDLKFQGTSVCYSWASHGGLESYTRDMANADSTVIRLEGFLKDLVSKTGATTVHLVAHSMGNRALLQALDRIAVSQSQPGPMFGQLVMAAPDVSSADFKNRYADAIRTLTQRATLYASTTDRALIASTSVHGHNRAGLAGENIVIERGIDTIDVSGIDTSLIGHSYYGNHPKMIDDMKALVELSTPASGRSWLARILMPDGASFYRFR